MPTSAIRHSPPRLFVRDSVPADIDSLVTLEARVFPDDCMSRRSLQRFLASPTAAVLIAERGDRVAGCGVLLFRAGTTIARLYSLAVDPASAGCGVGRAILDAAEGIALTRGCRSVRLEVHEQNIRAIACYSKAGYREFARVPRYYEDKGTALRFEKCIGPQPGAIGPMPTARPSAASGRTG